MTSSNSPEGQSKEDDPGLFQSTGPGMARLLPWTPWSEAAGSIIHSHHDSVFSRGGALGGGEGVAVETVDVCTCVIKSLCFTAESNATL